MQWIKTAIVAGFLSLGACVSQDRPAPDLNCSIDPAQPYCVLERGYGLLQSEQDGAVWVNGAAELAQGYDRLGRSQRAYQLLQQAIQRAGEIEELKRRKGAYSDILVSSAALEPNASMLDIARVVFDNAEQFDALDRADLEAKYAITLAVHESGDAGLQAALSLPQTNAYDTNYKAVALRKIAQILAKNENLGAARQTIAEITMSISYYQALARTDVAREAFAQGDTQLALTLIEEADIIARAQENGYFVGAALRDIAYSLHLAGLSDQADQYFDEAIRAAKLADEQNEKARATSRIATRLADAGLVSDARPLLDEAIALSKDIETGPRLGFTQYEIAGAAAFSGAFELSRSLIELTPDAPLGDAQSMKSAAQRDFAWGLARFGQTDAALTTCDQIKTQREQIQCFARVARVIWDPEQVAPPRYL